jgi:hypothetical protein
MIGDYSPENPDRPRGFLTERDRKYLTDKSDIEPYSQHERDVRRDIRRRTWQALLDLTLVAERMDTRDRDPVFAADRDRDRGLDTDEQAARVVARQRAFRALASLLYRYAGDGDQVDRLDAVERLLEHAITTVDRDEREDSDGSDGDGDGDDRVLQLAEPDVTISVDYPRRIDLDVLESKWEQQTNADGWDWSVFSTDELLFTLWQTVRLDDEITRFDAAMIAALQNRLADEWAFVDVDIDRLREQAADRDTQDDRAADAPHHDERDDESDDGGE